MAQDVAFLRAINVGGHTVKMADLRRSFEALGFNAVETHIASGNVIFETDATDATELERRIEDALQADLGYRVDTFVRTADELAAIASHRPFDGVDVEASGWRSFIVFLGAPPGAGPVERLLASTCEFDTFEVDDRQVYWLVRGRYSDSRFSGALLEKTLGMPATVRGAPTVRQIAAKLG
ncbi:MAG: DUF1697 domain-containing protein [Candidatus Limnocylindrales bacterium]